MEESIILTHPNIREYIIKYIKSVGKACFFDMCYHLEVSTDQEEEKLKSILEELIRDGNIKKDEEMDYHYEKEVVEWKKDIQEKIMVWNDYIHFAEQFYEKNPFFYDRNKIWWIWNKNKWCWEIIDETDIMNEIDKVVNVALITTKNSIKNEIIESLKRVGRKNMPKEAPKTWVQFNKNIIDMETDSVFNSSPEYFCTNPIPWNIGKSDDTPTMDRIFEDWVGKENIPLLYEIIAYTMLPDYPIHRVFCLNGSGLNGKSKYISLLVKFIGEDNVCSSDLDVLSDSRFEGAKLYKKLLCALGETNLSAMKKTQLLKRLTGQDPISIEFKNKNPFDSINYAKIIIATNSLPITYDRTVGWYRRWIIIDFNNQFTEKKDILSEIPEEEYNNLVKKCIKVLKNLLNKREFTNEGSIEERMKKYEKASNPIERFIDENCIQDIDQDIPYYQFYEKLCIFLKQNKYRSLNYKEVKSFLDEIGYERKKVHITRDGKKTTMWVILGLSWSNNQSVIPKDTNDTVSLYTPLHGNWSRKSRSSVSSVSQEEKIFNNLSNGCEKGIVPWMDFHDKLKYNGVIDPDFMIHDMLKNGVIFEPKPGFLKKL